MDSRLKPSVLSPSVSQTERLLIVRHGSEDAPSSFKERCHDTSDAQIRVIIPPQPSDITFPSDRGRYLPMVF